MGNMEESSVVLVFVDVRNKTPGGKKISTNISPLPHGLLVDVKVRLTIDEYPNFRIVRSNDNLDEGIKKASCEIIIINGKRDSEDSITITRCRELVIVTDENKYMATKADIKRGTICKNEESQNSTAAPPPGAVKINFTGDVRGEKIAIGVVVRNSDGAIIDSCVNLCNVDFVSESFAKARAVSVGNRFARDKSWERIIVEGDLTNDLVSGCLNCLVENYLKDQFTDLAGSFVPEEANQEASELCRLRIKVKNDGLFATFVLLNLSRWNADRKDENQLPTSKKMRVLE